MSADERAKEVARAIWAKDSASKFLGMQIEEVIEGQAILSLEVQEHHCNGHRICHGGIIFSLADSAFAFACNSRNQSTVAHHNMISFVAPALAGDQLVATARETNLSGRNGIYDVQVVNQDGKTIAEMRGLSRAIKGTILDDETGKKG